MTLIEQNYARFPETDEREREPDPDRVRAKCYVQRVARHLRDAHEAFLRIPEPYRDNLNGRFAHMDPEEFGSEADRADAYFNELEAEE